MDTMYFPQGLKQSEREAKQKSEGMMLVSWARVHDPYLCDFQIISLEVS
jgi:hypothetical protein